MPTNIARFADGQKFKTMFDNLFEGCQIIDYDWRYVYLNDAAIKHAKRGREELVGKTMMEMYPGIEKTSMFSVLKQVMKKRQRQILENLFIYPDGSEGWFELSVEPVEDGILIFSQDISERKKNEERIFHLNSLLKAISRVNQLIVKAQNQEDLFHGLCDHLVSARGYRLVWVGLKENNSFEIKPAAFAGFDNGFLSKTIITWDESEYGQGPAGLALRTGKSQIIADLEAEEKFKPWLKEAQQRKFRSAAAVPIIFEGQVLGVFNIYSDSLNAFGAEEMELLEEVAGDISFVLGVMQIKRKLEESEKMFRTLVEAAHDMIYVIDKKFIVKYVNFFAAKQTRLPVEKVIGWSMDNFFPPAIAERQKRNLSRVFSSQDPLYVEAESKIGDKDCWLGTWLVPIFNDKKVVEAVLGVSRDITAQKNTEKKLEETRKNLERITEQSLDAIVVHDGKQVLFANSATLEMVGASSLDEVVGKDVASFVHPDSREVVKRRIGEMMKTGQSVGFVEEKFLRLDGTPIDVEVGSSPTLFNGHLAFLVTIRDVAKRRELETYRKENIKRIEKMNSFLVGRELKMRDLKKTVEQLKKDLNACLKKKV